jgi:DNA-directed RNA polymerase subunit N (RpoN/RPB10)
MLIPVVCLTCGLPIGDKAQAFSAMREKKTNKALEKAGVQASFASIANVQINLEDIFKALQVRNDCCRAHLSMAMEIAKFRQ